jgi:hypothetical protein
VFCNLIRDINVCSLPYMDMARTSDRLSQVKLKIHSVPRSKHSVSVIKTSQLILYREVIAVCSQIHTKHINKRRIIYTDPARTAQ